MSDIGGVFQWAGTHPVTSALLQRMEAALNWYGAPQRGQWHLPHCGLMHVGKEFAAEDAFDCQPVTLSDAQLTVVAVARLDYRNELCDALSIPVAERAVTPDSLLIAHAYLRWKEDCPQHLRGDFAFALWDGQRQQLLCVRDQRGNVPFFYYAEDGKRLVFATSVHGVFAVPQVPRQLNPQMLADRLTNNGNYDGSQSFFHNIKMLCPAHLLLANRNGLTTRAYWQWQPGQELQFKRDEEYVEALREVLFKAVKSRMRGIYPVGAHMSGGLDSSSVAVIAARELAQRQQTLPTFTQVPMAAFSGRVQQGRSADDRHLAAAIQQRQANITSHLVDIEGLDLEAGLDRFFDWACIPPLNATNRLWLERIYQQAADQKLGALLTGEVGNSTVSTSTMAQRIDTLARQGHWWTLWHELTQAGKVSNRSPLRLMLGHLAQWSPLSRISPGPTKMRRNWRQNSLINPLFAERMHVEERLEYSRSSGFEPVREVIQRLKSMQLLMSRNQSPVYAHAYSNGFGVKSLDPTGDFDVVSFCLAVPDEQYFHQGWDRALIRRAMDPFLPPEVIWRQIRGEQAADWMLCLDSTIEKLKSDVAAMARSPLAAEVLDVAAMQQLLQRWQSGAGVYNNSPSIFHIRLLRAWLIGRFILWFEQPSRMTVAA